MIENRRRYRPNAFRHSGVYEYAMFPGGADAALHLAALAFRKMAQNLVNSLPVRMECEKQVSLGRVERQDCSQPDMELDQFRLGLTDPHNHRAIARPEAKH